jgi:hypothetical protein
LAVDPRLLSSAAAFKDAVRRQFNGENLLINIRNLELEYINLNLTTKGPLTKIFSKTPEKRLR